MDRNVATQQMTTRVRAMICLMLPAPESTLSLHVRLQSNGGCVVDAKVAVSDSDMLSTSAHAPLRLNVYDTHRTATLLVRQLHAAWIERQLSDAWPWRTPAGAGRFDESAAPDGLPELV